MVQSKAVGWKFHMGTEGNHGGYTVEVSINNYLDIYFPYNRVPDAAGQAWSPPCCTWSMARDTPSATTGSAASCTGSATSQWRPGAIQILWEVLALHALLAELWIPAWPRVLLHLFHVIQCCEPALPVLKVSEAHQWDPIWGLWAHLHQQIIHAAAWAAANSSSALSNCSGPSWAPIQDL